MGVYSQFCETRSVLFSTDVASRGLDFNKAVDWVIQVSNWFFKVVFRITGDINPIDL